MPGTEWNSFGCCMNIAAKDGAVGPSGYYEPKEITTFPQGVDKPTNRIYRCELDNRYTTLGAPATENIYLYFMKKGQSFHCSETLVFYIRAGEQWYDEIAGENLYTIMAQNDSGGPIYRVLHIMGRPI